MSAPHLNQRELSRRWHISPCTLEQWRSRGTGPRYLKIGGKVLYRQEDIEAYESENLHQCGRRNKHDTQIEVAP